MPKMICDDDQLRTHANEVAGYLHRNGNLLLELSMAIERKAAITELPFGADFTFVRHIPSPDPEWPDIKQLLWIRLEDFPMHWSWAGRGYVKFHHSLSSGLGALAPGRVTGAWYSKFSWVLPWAKVLKEWKE